MDHDRDAAPLPLGELFAEGPFPPHHPGCYGCGPANPASPHMTFERHGDLVRSTFVLDERHQGAPGVAHGGIVSAALDEASGSVLMPLRLPAVTVKLEVDFLVPVQLHRELTVTSKLVGREGRKLFIHTALTDGDTVVATGRAIFVEVTAAHFQRFGATPGELSSVGA
ncbi:PaaI family thioesterase [Nocardia tengchongensis]|uniref:Acyl-coenzyme A thioesterase THEM4 n=1 Tax=Nocardia tengchongensis TaxID=2055889 RepID=A0ABX8CNQ8_9NOCA|nr:PaaI family thioesterase [Nocardia tengchongensis]QVI21576.1 PaaI family thioesterase [Nocardia tengchongensis]